MPEKNIHLIPDHFISRYFIEKIEEFYGAGRNIYFVRSFFCEEVCVITDSFIKSISCPIYRYQKGNIKGIIEAVDSDTKVFFHRLEASDEVLINKLKPIAKEINWIFWGEFETYSRYGSRKKFLSDKTKKYVKKDSWAKASLLKKFLLATGIFYIREEFRGKVLRRKHASVIQKIDHFLHWSYEDYQCVREMYSISPKNFPEFMNFRYGFSVRSRYPKPTDIDGSNASECIRFLVGHSAHPSVNHIDAIDAVSDHSVRFGYEADMKVYVPLSYGDADYSKFLERYGATKLVARFYPIFRIMDKREYDAFLDSIDFAFFPIKNSSAAGNIFTLLGKGKVIFMDESGPFFRYLVRRGYTIFSLSDFHDREIKWFFKRNDPINNWKLVNEEFGMDSNISLFFPDIFC